MQDGYEVQGSCLDPANDDAAANADGDGLTNLAEQGALLDPCALDAPRTWQVKTTPVLTQEYYELAGHDATLLLDGKVLVTGIPEFNTIRADVYDPQADSWNTTSPVISPTYGFATLLAGGKVLVAQSTGLNNGTAVPQTYDPITDTWALADTGWQGYGGTCYRTTGTALADGRALIVSCAGRTQLYDATVNSWLLVASANGFPESVDSRSVTLLGDGRVLAAGGYGYPQPTTSEIFDPQSEQWIAGGVMSAPRPWHSATLLPNGKVLVAGGGDSVPPYALATAELYDPIADTWEPTSPMLHARLRHTATLLPNGKVLVAGGSGNSTSISGYQPPDPTTELYDPVTGTWEPGAPMSMPHGLHTATLLNDGAVLVIGGESRLTGGVLPIVWAEAYADYDNDFLSDGYEVVHACLVPNTADSSADPDSDGLSSLTESIIVTDPCNPPTLPVSVGGIAEEADVTALPSATASARDDTVYMLGAFAALIMAAAGAVGWRRRRE